MHGRLIGGGAVQAACAITGVLGLSGALTIQSASPGRTTEGGDEANRLLFQLWRHATVLVVLPLRPCISVATFKQLLAASANAILVELENELSEKEDDKEILRSLQECSITSLQHGLPIDNQARLLTPFDAAQSIRGQPGGQLDENSFRCRFLCT